jgi:hypothetical protein
MKNHHYEISAGRRAPGGARWTLTALSVAAMLLMWLGAGVGRLHAQVGTGDILGTVTDSSGAVVVGAKVTVKDQGTAAMRTAITNDKGEYTFSTLPIGTYALTVEMAGFKTYKAAGLPLSTGDRSRYDAKLETGAVTETVEVTGQTAEMQTDSSEVTSTVEQSAVADLPLNGRSLEAAIQAQPGIMYAQNGNSPNDRRPSFDIAAANGGLNNEMVDGFDNNERTLGLDGLRPSVDSVQEVKVDTSSYSAEYGRASGAVVNTVTKAGTNTYHGSLYEFFRNDIFDAYDYFAVSKPELRLNYYGGSLGGAVWIPKLYNGKNKTFFFVDYEQYRLIQGINSVPISGPTLAEEQEMISGGDLNICDVATTATGPYSALTNGPYTNGPFSLASECDIPAANIDPIMKNYFLMFPKPNYGTPGNGTNNFIANPPETQNLSNLDVRIDQHIGSKDLLFGRYEYDPTKTVLPNEYPQITAGTIAAGIYSSADTPFEGIYPGGNGTGFSGPAVSNTYGLQLDEVHIFNQNLLMDLKAGYTRINIQSLPWDYNNGAATTAGWSTSLNLDGGMPSIGGPFSAWSALIGSPNALPVIDVNNTFQYAGSVTYTHGAHDFKVGAGLIRRQANAWQDSIVSGFFLQAGVDNSGSPIAPKPGGPPGNPLPYADDRENFLSGNPFLEIRGDNYYKAGYRTWEPSVYVLDNWRVNSKLTLNLGVRYDIYTPFTEAHGHYDNFLTSCLDASATTTLVDGSSCWVTGAQSPTIGVKTDYKDIQPRVGFAYSLDKNTVLRGAFGTAYFTPDTGMTRIGSGSPADILQNYNPQSALTTTQPFPFGPPGPSYCTLATNGVGGGATGCIDEGPVQPIPLTDAQASAFATNPNINSVSAKDPNFKNQYAEMGNLALQRQFGANTVTAAWVGSFGRHMFRADNLDWGAAPGAGNPASEPPYGYTAGGGPPGSPPPTPVGELPNMTVIAFLHNGSMSSYNAMQLVYDRRFAQGLHMGANYVWGHLLANSGGDNIPDEEARYPDLQYGGRPSQRVAVTAGYELPFGKNLKGAAGVVAKGWKFNGIGFWQNGSSLTVTSGSFLNIVNVNNDRPNEIANPKLSKPTINQWFNSCKVGATNPATGVPCTTTNSAWQDQTLGTYGSEHVNQVLGPPTRDIDLSMDKSFPIFEHLTGQFRAECFNITNTPNFGNPNGTSGTGSFGQITSTVGNPRQWQFAMKLLF